MNKKAQFFSIYLVVLTLFMCISVIILYINQQKNIDLKISSPKSILVLRDKLDYFEMREKKFIYESLLEAGKQADFNKDRDLFLKIFRESFIMKIREDEESKKFLLEDIYIDGFINKENIIYESFISNYVYPEKNFEYKNGKVVVSRNKLTKKFFIRNLNTGKKGDFLDFSVVFNFEKKYLISYSDSGFLIEEA